MTNCFMRPNGDWDKKTWKTDPYFWLRFCPLGKCQALHLDPFSFVKAKADLSLTSIPHSKHRHRNQHRHQHCRKYLFWTVLILDWLYLSLHWSECNQNFKEDPSKVADHIKKIKMPNPSQEPPASSKAPNEDLKDIDVLCTFKIKIEPKFGSWVYQRPMT